ncbi:MAG: MarR family transcriptional regulator [Phycisphaerales bacterium]|nr:MarR family transcriptional regulator [Hyphomonadaceae bacterium]
MSDESEAFRLASSPSHLLHRAEQLAADRFSQLVEDKITLRQFAVLAAIGEAPGLSQSDLVRATGVDRSTVGDMMSRMERNRWITRSASEADARAHAVNLAPEGERLLAAAMHHARAADAAILDALPRTKGRTFLNVLTKLAKLSDELAEKADREARKKAKKEARAKAPDRKREKSKGSRKPRPR